METEIAGRLHAFLAGVGRDDAGRHLDDVLAMDDGALETTHDYIQWLFPLPTRSMSQPQAPVLTSAEIEAIRADPRAAASLERATGRMLDFFRHSRAWLASSDHNHLRISRILQSQRILVGPDAARNFYEAITAMVAAANARIDPHNRRYWDAAVGK